MPLRLLITTHMKEDLKTGLKSCNAFQFLYAAAPAIDLAYEHGILMISLLRLVFNINLFSYHALATYSISEIANFKEFCVGRSKIKSVFNFP